MTRRLTPLVWFIGLLAVASGPAAAAQQAEPRTIHVVAKRFAFEPSEIEVVEGERVRIAVTSGDGVHGFEIRQFKASSEIPRAGGPVIVEFTADVPGRFPIVCSLYCGEGHDGMRGALVVRARASGLGESAGSAPPQRTDDDPDLDFSAAQPDFTVVTLPTTLRLPRFKSAFRVTHRFRRPLGAGSIGDLVGDLFGLDAGAQIGLEYRFGVLRGLQAGIHRTSSKIIELFSQYNVLQQGGGTPIGLGILAAVDGTNNFRDTHSPALGIAASRTFGRSVAVYVEPMWVGNTDPAGETAGADTDTFLLGLATRIRVRSTVYVVGEIAPRMTGHDPGVTHGTIGIEKRAGGHMFQLNVSNGFGTTLSRTARGGITNDDWYLGFNISRKFF